ncbi:hypothetical protein NGRA_2322 [Nosema granulosis]|uniref:Uncharacterized protein n=1 Tax=Nosema granulosis TaxID=83296 RepID=A0A9P6KYS0_9MICR|nr:hypothetical protein NGRA_2322 [Nosema granulosis]
MVYPIDFYQEPECSNDLLYLSYIVSGNVEKIIESSENLVVVPKNEDLSFFNTILSTFSEYFKFYKELKAEGEYQKEIEYFKKRFEKLSFITAYELYKKLKKWKIEEEPDYNLEAYTTAVEANNIAISKGLEYAPQTIANFYKKYKNKTKYKKLIKEAKNVKFSQ